MVGLMAALLLQSETPAMIAERLFQSDMSNFVQDDKNFGIRRIRPTKVGTSHYVAGYWPDGVSRFLVGNFTDKLTAKTFRVQYVPRYGKHERKDPTTGKVIKVEGEKAPKDFDEALVSRLMVRHFGKEFMEEVGPRKVFGYKIKAAEKCLSCHTWAKQGDALGYMVYGIPSN